MTIGSLRRRPPFARRLPRTVGVREESVHARSGVALSRLPPALGRLGPGRGRALVRVRQHGGHAGQPLGAQGRRRGGPPRQRGAAGPGRAREAHTEAHAVADGQPLALGAVHRKIAGEQRAGLRAIDEAKAAAELNDLRSPVKLTLSTRSSAMERALADCLLPSEDCSSTSFKCIIRQADVSWHPSGCMSRLTRAAGAGLNLSDVVNLTVCRRPETAAPTQIVGIEPLC
eukprot:CAMPEP_0168358256 /NCGR_PEP_ID=MMETSP0228-20121227/1014_1 /TAXON_ID=133427 /ORGANISM="Protoceratium reticulatum, Strain CCCM 535 (=CCMP 1889)" /LENGTH=228 /DNA_ID=CAMNT_0008370811 /DNA_START=210 /DNA_END=897 /DNA_ORIENTATION=+